MHRGKFRIGCEADGKLVGVVQCARHFSRHLYDGNMIEAVRLRTDGSPNVCSFLYSREDKASKAMGYRRMITYTLESEDGASLRVCGWSMGKIAGGLMELPEQTEKQSAPIRKKNDGARQ